MTQVEVKALIQDLRMNHEYVLKEIILQAADELERMQKGIETLHAMYEQTSLHCNELMDARKSMVAAMRGKI